MVDEVDPQPEPTDPGPEPTPIPGKVAGVAQLKVAIYTEEGLATRPTLEYVTDVVEQAFAAQGLSVNVRAEWT